MDEQTLVLPNIVFVCPSKCSSNFLTLFLCFYLQLNDILGFLMTFSVKYSIPYSLKGEQKAGEACRFASLVEIAYLFILETDQKKTAQASKHTVNKKYLIFA